MVEPPYQKTELDLFQLAFGYRALPFPLGELNNLIRYQQIFKKKGDEYDLQKDLEENHDADSGFTNEYGFPCLFPIILTDPLTNKSYTLPNATLEIRDVKNIVTTPLVGCKGEVNELMSVGSSKISIRGVIVNKGTDITLHNELAQLRELWNINTSLKLVDSFTKYALEANELMIVIKERRLPDMKGVSYAQAYELETQTDIDIELTLK